MVTRLGEADGKALDLLLDRPQTDGAAQPAFRTPHASTVQERVNAVDKVLRILASMPAADPPPDLVARTIKFIESGALPTGGRAAQPAASPRQPRNSM